MKEKLKTAVAYYRNQLEKILEIEKDPRDYLNTTTYKDIPAFQKNPKKFLETFGWRRDYIGLNVHATRKLLEMGIIRHGYRTKRDRLGWFRLNISIKDLEEALKEKDKMKNQSVEIPDDLFDFIIGFNDYKWLIKRSLQSKDQVHVLLTGGPSLAKSVFLWELSRIKGAHFYVASQKFTKAGLVDLLFEEEPKILIIDEIEKTKKEDYGALLSLMEGGIVTKMLHGERMKIKLDTKVYAACNELLKLPLELRSRFIILKFKEYTKEQFIKVVSSLLVKREKKDKKFASYVADKLVGITKDVRDAIKVARLAENKEEVDKVVKIMREGGGW